MAFPDRIGKRQGKRWKLSNGSAVDFHPEQIPANSELIIVVEYSSSRYGQYIQSYFPLTLNEVEADLPELLVEDEVVCWSEQKQQPQKSKQTRIGHLILREQPLALNLSDSQWQDIWCQYISDNGLKVMAWNEAECLALRNQLALVKRHMSHLCWPDWSEPELLRRLTSWLGPYINDVRSAQQLKRLRLAEILRNSLDWSLQQTLAQACPSHYQTPAGNRAKIDYSGEQPKLSVKLQEMFGEPVTPTVCNGKQALIIELLSPAKRPLQVTQDLQNFWQNAYTEVKKEMKGRYPKHPWPDDPLTSQATSKTKSQLSRDQKNKH